ncbi:TPA: hypothetical protein JD169_21985, partial [Cronobacter malonaticus]|nr:hypothetical protein [Cronobacter malonaticus]
MTLCCHPFHCPVRTEGDEFYLLKCTFEKVALPKREVKGIILLLFTMRNIADACVYGGVMTELPDDNLLPGAFSGEHFSDLR